MKIKYSEMQPTFFTYVHLLPNLERSLKRWAKLVASVSFCNLVILTFNLFGHSRIQFLLSKQIFYHVENREAHPRFPPSFSFPSFPFKKLEQIQDKIAASTVNTFNCSLYYLDG
jgi:hypothetical protein